MVHLSPVPPACKGRVTVPNKWQQNKWQQHTGALPAGAKFDLFLGGEKKRAIEPETFVSVPGPTIIVARSCRFNMA